jgi:hypothetical protein
MLGAATMEHFDLKQAQEKIKEINKIVELCPEADKGEVF